MDTSTHGNDWIFSTSKQNVLNDDIYTKYKQTPSLNMLLTQGNTLLFLYAPTTILYCLQPQKSHLSSKLLQAMMFLYAPQF